MRTDLAPPEKRIPCRGLRFKKGETQTTKATTRARYTLEFRQEAVRLVEGGQGIATAAARTPGVVDQTLFNWVKARRQGRLNGADRKAVSAELLRSSQ